ncbi:TetR/AcrR family transcriptional regulator [uncultured Microbacterium sp.]|uniref:TetR/AcrR family transcriptional regulator n=1 Tax=uncultured Microbacterium sp. TaxID=191216 RepID=UPI0035CAD0CF
MTNRNVSAEQTRSAVLGATLELLGEKSSLEIVLADVSDRSGVTVKTVLRHFGSRDGLFDAVSEFAENEIIEERVAPVGDLDAAISTIVDHYEHRGDWVVRLLGQEQTDARIARAVGRARDIHRAWVKTVFASDLAAAAESSDERADLLVVATDVYTWKLLRRDFGRSRAVTEASMRALAAGVLASHQGGVL